MAMTWLTTAGGGILDLKEDKGFLTDVLNIQHNRLDFQQLGLENPLDVLERLAGGADAALPALLEKIGVDPNDLRQRFVQLKKELIDQQLEEFHFLLMTFGDLAKSGNTVEPEYVWPLLDQGKEQSGTSASGGGQIQWKMAANLALSATVQALAELPKGMVPDPRKKRHLRLAMAGSLSAGAGLGGGNAVVSVGVSGQAKADTQVEFWFRHLDQPLVGEALLVDLGNLVSPFELEPLGDGLHRGNLAAVRFRAAHELTFGGKVGFGTSLKLGGEVAATFDFSSGQSGEFEYLVRAAGDGRGVAVRIRRVDAHAEQSQAALGLTVDMTRWAERVYPMVKDHLDKAGAIIQRFEAVLPGQALFRDKLGAALGDRLGDFEYKEQLLQGLGLADGGDPAGVLGRALSDRMQSARTLWSGALAQRAADLKAELLANLPPRLGVQVIDKLDDALGDALEDGLKALDEALEKEIGKLLKGDKFKALCKELGGLGHGVDAGVSGNQARLDQVIGPVRAELDGFQKRLNELKKHFDDASKAKIAMRFSALSREEHSDTLDMELVIDPAHEDAQAVLNGLVRGDFQAVFRQLIRINGSLTGSPGGAITRIDRGGLTRYARFLEAREFSLVLFGYGMSGKTSIDADAKLVTDLQGNITVLSTAEFKKLYRPVGGEERELNIVDTVELANAGATGAVTLGLNLSLTDDDLGEEDARAFFGSARQAGLLPASAVAKAVQAIGDNGLKSARLDVGMSLTREQLLRLIRVTDPGGTLADQPAFDRQAILRLAAEKVAEICAQQPPTEELMRDIDRFLAEMPPDVPVGGDLAEMIVGMTRKRHDDALGPLERMYGELQRPQAELHLSWVRNRHVAVLGCHGDCAAGRPRDGAIERADTLGTGTSDAGDTQKEQWGLVDALETMREVYLDREPMLEGDVDWYARKQREIGRAFSSWFNWPGGGPRWWMFGAREIRPVTLALFRTIAELVTPEGGGRLPQLSAALTLKGDREAGKKRIPLT